MHGAPIPSSSSATNYFGIVHPSLPNCMAITGGDSFFVCNDIHDHRGASDLVPPEDHHDLTIFVKPDPRTADSDASYNHYSLLRTIEMARDLEPMTDNDRAASAMKDMIDLPRAGETHQP